MLMSKDAITRKQAAQMIGCLANFVDDLAKREKLYFEQIEGFPRIYSKKSVEKYIKGNHKGGRPKLKS